jgi:hypothetical protein
MCTFAFTDDSARPPVEIKDNTRHTYTHSTRPWTRRKDTAKRNTRHDSGNGQGTPTVLHGEQNETVHWRRGARGFNDSYSDMGTQDKTRLHLHLHLQ